MCLLLIAVRSHPVYKLIIAANRDEYYERPTAPASFWNDAPDLLAGRDLRAGGTWFGVTKKGRIAAITNYRDPSSIKSAAPSRGGLVTGFLSSDQDPVDYLLELDQKAGAYNGFNLVVGDKDRLYWYSNRGDTYQPLFKGIHGLSNHLLDTPWHKVSRGRTELTKVISDHRDPSPNKLFRLLTDRTRPEDNRLPDTGVGLIRERMLSPIFIISPDYGTRSSALLFIDRSDHLTFLERTYPTDRDRLREVRYEFEIKG